MSACETYLLIVHCLLELLIMTGMLTDPTDVPKPKTERFL